MLELSDTGDICSDEQVPKSGARTDVVNMQLGATATCQMTPNDLSGGLKNYPLWLCLSVKRVPVKVVCVKVRAVHWQRVQLTRARKVNNFVKLQMTYYLRCLFSMRGKQRKASSL